MLLGRINLYQDSNHHDGYNQSHTDTHNRHAIDHHNDLRMMLMSNSLSPDRKIIDESLEAIKDVGSLAQSRRFGCDL